MERGFEMAEQFPTNEAFKEMITKVQYRINEDIENQIKELLKPYIDTTDLKLIDISKTLKESNLTLIREETIRGGERYIVRNTVTGEEDYFCISQPQMNENNRTYTYKYINYISDIVRGIKKDE